MRVARQLQPQRGSRHRCVAVRGVLAPQRVASRPADKQRSSNAQPDAPAASEPAQETPHLRWLRERLKTPSVVPLPALPAPLPAQQPGAAAAASTLDCGAFLARADAEEVKRMRMCAHLGAQTYYMGQLTPRKLQLWHNLQLVTTSLCCERLVFEPGLTDEEAAMDADGMAGPSLQQALQVYCSSSDAGDAAAGDGSSSSSSGPAAAAGANNVVPLSRTAAAALTSITALASEDASSSGGGGSSSSAVAELLSLELLAAEAPAEPGGERAAAASSSSALVPASSSSKRSGSSSWNPADLVAAKLSEAAAAAAAASTAAMASTAAASAAALQPLASAAGSLYAGSLSLVSSVTGSAMLSGVLSGAGGLWPWPSGASSERVVAEAISRIASAEIAASHPNSVDVKAASTSAGSRCPSEWFVADTADGGQPTRYFVIQGSDSIDHWRVNLTFEPVAFEGAASGIRVHRGAYEAALVLYDRFLPLVQEAVQRDACARVCFTGHSIGGAIAVLLTLMFRHRGVLLPQQLAPTYTFGAPGVLCDAECSCCATCTTDPATGAESCSLGQAAPPSLLARMGLPDDAVRSVVMTRDIVPRAFSCDYSLVAELLRSWGPSWREHSCLGGAGRRQLYRHIGRAFVLQPSPELPFVTEASPHLPMLPPEGELFELLPRPSLAAAMAAARRRRRARASGSSAGDQPAVQQQQPAAGPEAAAAAGQQHSSWPARSTEEVLAAVMDTPHPLETLAEPGSYGNNGSISRFHNPDHYCLALGRVLRDRRSSGAAHLGRPFAVPAHVRRARPRLDASSCGTRSAGAAAHTPAAPPRAGEPSAA